MEAPEASLAEDYVNMDLISSSPSKSKEFEYQHFSTPNYNPADDLIYKGTLLPLNLPPRRQMFQHLLLTPTTTAAAFLTCSTAPCTNSNTPLDSCNISPSQSCRVSCELNPSDTLFEWPTELTGFFKNQPRSQSWSKKLKMKLTNHSLLAQKLKSSRVYLNLKSLFAKSACSDKENNYFKFVKRVATSIKKDPVDDQGSHRRSFSGAFAAHSTTKCSSNSSSSSTSTLASHELHFSRRSSSAADIEVSIDAAIAHCKKSFGICSSPSPKYVPSSYLEF